MAEVDRLICTSGMLDPRGEGSRAPPLPTPTVNSLRRGQAGRGSSSSGSEDILRGRGRGGMV